MANRFHDGIPLLIALSIGAGACKGSGNDVPTPPVPSGSGGATSSGGNAGAAGSSGTGGRATSDGSGGGPGTGGARASGGSGGSLGGPADAGRPEVGGRGGSADAAAPPAIDSGAVDPGPAGDGDFTVTVLTMQTDLTDRGAPKGKRFQFVMDSTKSTIFDGSDSTVNKAQRELTRQVSVYVPAQYKDGTPAPILVLQDGPPVAPGWGDGPPFDAVSRALDNLTISKDPARKLPAFIAIGVQNGGSDSKGSERGLEYDTLSDRYARFVQLEVLPAVLANAQIKAAYPNLAFTDDPEGKGTYGCSSGAAASFTMAWFRPDLFRRVITYSGTFVAQQNAGQPESPIYPLGAWEYHSSMELIANTAPIKPLRVHLNANEMDNGYTAPESGHHNWVIANQRMAAAMKAKGYHYRYDFVMGLGHCDYNAWRATLADTLVWLWSGYPTN